jgi:hypothetical protein
MMAQRQDQQQKRGLLAQGPQQVFGDKRFL